MFYELIDRAGTMRQCIGASWYFFSDDLRIDTSTQKSILPFKQKSKWQT
jgi:hypothetical protein